MVTPRFDQLVQAVDEFGVLQDQAVCIDEFRNLARQRSCQLVTQATQFVARAGERIVQSLQFPGDLGLFQRCFVDQEAARLLEASASKRHAA